MKDRRDNSLYNWYDIFIFKKFDGIQYNSISGYILLWMGAVSIVSDQIKT